MQKLRCGAMVLLVAACADPSPTDTRSLQSPQAVSRSIQAGEAEITIIGQTYGPQGQFYIQSGGMTLTGDSLAYLPNNNISTDSSWFFETWEVQSGLSDPDAVPYDGGIATIGAIIDGAESPLGEITGNMESSLSVFHVPTGTSIRFTAHPNAGCAFSGWGVRPGGPYLSQELVYEDGGGPDARRYWAVFNCGH
jgi:hypothetical protein